MVHFLQLNLQITLGETKLVTMKLSVPKDSNSVDVTVQRIKSQVTLRTTLLRARPSN